ncbi:acyl-CoA dehydrogenase family protein [Kallotenue papyrolyticum]|uniref:acyl-CoA dehydrogenase family protein n=1 Tax=Kallotenue papyrolyticum TaxID=1325125 RepID=UPI0004928CA0|nr:acyl-CoA dehydrogenase family protein [Kallotenue papyrolyticum]
MAMQATDRALDFYLFDELLTPEERAVRDRVRTFFDEEVTPIINPYWERGEFPFELIPKLAQLNVAGGTIQGYGCPGLSSVAAGLVGMEMARGDGSICTFFGVTSGLAMGAIYYCGSEEQRQQWLPAMARLEKIGAFGLTEPWIGSDAAHIQTTATRVGDRYVLNGAKRWIGNASFADVTVIWARDSETGQVSGFLVEKGTPGFETTVMQGKLAKRAVLNADIRLTNCEIPEANRLAHANSFKDTANVLKNTRYGVAWEAVGHALAAFEIARAYALKRQQFGRPIASYQLIQQKLVQMLGEVTAMQLLCWRLSKLRDEDKMTEGMASLAKQQCAARARQVVALGREILGGNGILLDYNIARHFADMEAVYTYEGSNEINTLVVGREITGLQAFVG